MRARWDRLAHYLTGTLGVSLLSLLLFAWIAHENVEGDYASWNQQVFAWAQRLHATSPWLTGLALAVTRTGDLFGYALGVLTLVWLRRRYGGGAEVRCFLLLMLGCPALVMGLKLMFALPRPLVDGLPTTSGYAFPSGHTLFSTCLYGYLGIRLVERRQRGGWLLVLWPVAVAWSRVLLSRHWLTDVVGGALVGTAWVGFCLYLRDRAANSRAANLCAATPGCADPGNP